jgi:hypothetical protein
MSHPETGSTRSAVKSINTELILAKAQLALCCLEVSRKLTNIW